MTGYGKAEALLPAGKLIIEIRTLNGKGADVGLKSHLLPKDREVEIRSLLASVLQRGTIDVFLSLEQGGAFGASRINASLFEAYYNRVREIMRGLDESDSATGGLVAAILGMPDVVASGSPDVIGEDNWPVVRAAFDEALAAVDAFRKREGEALYADVTGRVKRILSLYDEVEKLEPERLETVKLRLKKNLEALEAAPDPSRFEQELIYYLEKYDINEEKVRLREHCRYFLQTIETEPCPGKKLGFIIQEIGREINTTGSKANHQEIQKLVVMMKDELERIREQSMNIL